MTWFNKTSVYSLQIVFLRKFASKACCLCYFVVFEQQGIYWKQTQGDIVTEEFMDQMYLKFTHCHCEFSIRDKHSGQTAKLWGWVFLELHIYVDYILKTALLCILFLALERKAVAQQPVVAAWLMCKMESFVNQRQMILSIRSAELLVLTTPLATQFMVLCVEKIKYETDSVS